MRPSTHHYQAIVASLLEKRSCAGTSRSSPKSQSRQPHERPEYVTGNPSKLELSLADENIGHGLRLYAARWSNDNMDSETGHDLEGS